MDTQNQLFPQIRPEIAKGLTGYGIQRFSEEQSSLVNALKDGKDCLAKFNSGSGKTVAYLTGILERINLSVKQTQVLVLCPTRELSMNVKAVLDQISEYIDLDTVSLIGGHSMTDQRKELQKNPQIAVGTVGRVVDCIKRCFINPKNIEMLLLDELDEMFSRGFSLQIEDLLTVLPASVQIAFFSSTVSEEIAALKDKMLKDPVEIEGKGLFEPRFTVYSFVAETENKNQLLVQILSQLENKFLVFCKEDQIEEIADFLDSTGIECDALIEEEPYFDPETSFTTKALVLSDLNLELVPRFKGISVINYDLPSRTTYLKRISAKNVPIKTKFTFQLILPSEREKLEETLSSIGMGNKEVSATSDIPL